MVFLYCKICDHFLNTPSKIRASDLSLAKIKVARHYAQCHFQQNKQYSIRGVEKIKTVNGNEGESNKKMWAATRAGTTTLTSATPPAREAHFYARTIFADWKKCCCGVGGRDIAQWNRMRVKSIKIIRGLISHFASAFSNSSQLMPKVKNLNTSNTFAASTRKNSILAVEVLQKSKLQRAPRAPSKKKSERHPASE